jgi:alkylmercury lyase
VTAIDSTGRSTPESVQVELLSVSGCPNVDATRRMVHGCLTELGLDTTVIERVGRYRSPTVVVNGVDVMGAVAADGMDDTACRLDLPSRDRVLAALRAGLSRNRPLTLDSLRDAADDGTAVRSAGLPTRVRELHRQILRTFLGAGHAPDPAQVRAMAADLGVDVADGLARLAERDLVHCGQDGRIRVAYPFSGEPTAHRVQVRDRPAVDAMCAIDALGIPLMAGRDGVITSSDPSTKHAIRVVRHAEEWRWEPAETVVLLAQTTGCGPAGECLCPSILFCVDPEHAERYLAGHPELSGSVLGQAAAVEIARACFGSLLAA